MRALPAATVSRPPHTAANRTPTPMGRFHSHAKKWTVAESVFCVMNTSSRIRSTKPTISADHSAAARVNFTADSGETRYSPAVAVGSGGVPFEEAGGGRGSTGSLVIAPSLPFPASNETTGTPTHRNFHRDSIECFLN